MTENALAQVPRAQGDEESSPELLSARRTRVSPEPACSESTGHPRVDEVLDAVSRIADLTPAEQVEAYESVHGALQETLRTVGEG